jgi:acyl-CoA reductase-like NAD-dependent aldehyde dehydrogenase
MLGNTTKYRLGVSVLTTDTQRGRKIANMLNAGMIWINEVNIPFPQALWFGERAVARSGIVDTWVNEVYKNKAYLRRSIE